MKKKRVRKNINNLQNIATFPSEWTMKPAEKGNLA